MKVRESQGVANLRGLRILPLIMGAQILVVFTCGAAYDSSLSATLKSWLNALTMNHMRKHQKEYRQFVAEIGPETFKRALLTHRNRITTGWKRVGKVFRDKTKARESILEEYLAQNVSLSLHHSFCLNRKPKVKKLKIQPRRLQE